jgi:hypothetical protein
MNSRSKILLLLTIVSMLFFIASAQAKPNNQQFWGEDKNLPLIVPQPKYIEKGNWEIKLSAKDSPMAEILIEPGNNKLKIGAEEINKYIKLNGGKELPVNHIGRASSEQSFKIFIVSDVENNPIAAGFSAEENTIPKDRCSSQAYVIRYGKNSVFLGGYGEQGGLYAAITFCHLLKNKKDGVYVYKTKIDDYPDFSYRGDLGMGNIYITRGYAYSARKKDLKKTYIDTLQEVVDIGLHLKLNWMLVTQRNLIYNSHDYSGEINKYARDRGFMVNSTTKASFFGTPSNKKKAQEYFRKTGLSENDFMILRNRLFCWSKDNLLREFVREAMQENSNVFRYHCPDTGDENWGQRCDGCREKFGSDRAKADAHVINLFYKEVKKMDPDNKLVAVIQPYHSLYLNPDRYEFYEEYVDFYRRLTEMIPDDVWIAVREGDRESIKIWTDIVNNPVDFYLEPRRPEFTQLLAPNIRTVKTFYFPERKHDVLKVAIPMLSWYLDTPLAAEYSWNVNAPGSAFMDVDNKYEFHPRGKTNTDFINKVVPRAARYIWGEEAAPIVTDIYQSGLNLGLGISPFAAIKRLKENTAGIAYQPKAEDFAFQEEASKKVCKLCLRIMKEEVSVKHPFLIANATRLYKHTTAVKLLAPVYRHYFAAVNAVEKRELEKAKKEIELAKQINSAIETELKKEKVFVKQFPQKSGSFLSGYLKHKKPFELATEKLEEFHIPTVAEIEKITLPPALLKEVRNRVVKAILVKEPPVIDGTLDDPCWSTHKHVVKHFVTAPFTGKLELALNQTEAAVCYDKKNLYIFFYAYDANADSLVGKEHKRDSGALFKEDIVEVFLNPNKDNGNFAQFVTNTVESKFDLWKKPKTKAEPKTVYLDNWNPDWQVATKIVKNGWIAEMRIPLEIFSKSPSDEIKFPPQPGDIWRINLTRERRRIENSGIKYMEDSKFDDVEKFSKLLFVDE